jgi:tuftelin-interacting protein 11
VSFEEVAQWYAFQKSVFAEDFLALKGAQKGFTRELQLMNEAIELGPDAPTKLRRPETKAEPGTTTKSVATTKSAALPSHTHKISTFQSIVEEFAAEHNLLYGACTRDVADAAVQGDGIERQGRNVGLHSG